MKWAFDAYEVALASDREEAIAATAAQRARRRDA